MGLLPRWVVLAALLLVLLWGGETLGRDLAGLDQSVGELGEGVVGDEVKVVGEEVVGEVAVGLGVTTAALGRGKGELVDQLLGDDDVGEAGLVVL